MAYIELDKTEIERNGEKKLGINYNVDKAIESIECDEPDITFPETEIFMGDDGKLYGRDVK